MPPVHLIENPAHDTARLVNNQSVNSFISDNNELTITRSISDRKYSMMSFKPKDKNTVDIVITNGEYAYGLKPLTLKTIGSQDIRKKYSKTAKFGTVTVIILLLAMAVIVLFAMFHQPQPSNSKGEPIITDMTNASVYQFQDIANATISLVGDILVNGTTTNQYN